MVTYADMPWWLVMVIVFGVIGPFMRMSGRHWGRPGGSRVLRDQEVQRLEAALGERDQILEDLQRRIGEMEERLDFTERLLASRSAETVSRQ